MKNNTEITLFEEKTDHGTFTHNDIKCFFNALIEDAKRCLVPGSTGFSRHQPNADKKFRASHRHNLRKQSRLQKRFGTAKNLQNTK